jgi:hypothetical protein
MAHHLANAILDISFYFSGIDKTLQLLLALTYIVIGVNQPYGLPACPSADLPVALKLIQSHCLIAARLA